MEALYESIFTRNACRRYEEAPLSSSFFDEMAAAIRSFGRLYKEDTLSYRIVTETKGLFHVKAPHYLIVSGEGNEGEEEAAGFLFQQLGLWLTSNGLGCVWLGATKDGESRARSGDIITIAFGRPSDDPHRSRPRFKRKDPSVVTNDPSDSWIQAALLAPSGLNCQPWYFEKEEDQVLVYRQKLKAPLGLVYTLTPIDIGIALAHYMVACKNEGKSFTFLKSNDLPKKRGYYPFGIIK